MFARAHGLKCVYALLIFYIIIGKPMKDDIRGNVQPDTYINIHFKRYRIFLLSLCACVQVITVLISLRASASYLGI